MYRFEDFKEMFPQNDIDLEYMLRTVIHCKRVFKDKGNKEVMLEELIGLGDSWKNRACIDKLDALGYIRCVNKNHKFSNCHTYLNVSL